MRREAEGAHMPDPCALGTGDSPGSVPRLWGNKEVNKTQPLASQSVQLQRAVPSGAVQGCLSLRELGKVLHGAESGGWILVEKGTEEGPPGSEPSMCKGTGVRKLRSPGNCGSGTLQGLPGSHPEPEQPGERQPLTGRTIALSPGNPRLDLPDLLFPTDRRTCSPLCSPGATGAAGPTNRTRGPCP